MISRVARVQPIEKIINSDGEIFLMNLLDKRFSGSRCGRSQVQTGQVEVVCVEWL